MFKKILVGVDTSVETQHAFDDALSIAIATGASLSLMHVFSWDDAYDRCLAMLYSELEEMENKEELIEDEPLVKCLISGYQGHEQSEALIKYRVTAQKAGVPAAVASPHRGRPGRSLAQAAKLEQVDLIAVGSHDPDRSKTIELGGFRLGSVSHEVVHYAPCSVLIAHPKVSAKALANIHRILVALDGSEMSEIVFQESLDLAKTTGADLTLLHVLSPYEENRSLPTLQRWQERAVTEGVVVRVEELISENHSIGKAIAAFAGEKKFDLVFVGRHGLLEVQNPQILGHVSHYLVYHAPCSVIVIQPAH